MTKETIIAVDAMGGDGGPKVIMPSLRDFILENRSVKINVYGCLLYTSPSPRD